MALAAPTNITISRLYRVMGQNQFVQNIGSFPPKSFSIYGNISWTNLETENHAVVLTVNGRESVLLRSATVATDVLLGVWNVPEVSAKTASISVVLKSANETSQTTTANISVNGAAGGSFNDPMTTDGSNIVLPNWSGVVIGPFFQLQVGLANALRERLVALSSGQAEMGGIIQGLTYRAIRTFHAAQLGTRTYTYDRGPGYASAYRFITRSAYQPIGVNWEQTTSVTEFLFPSISQTLFFVAPAPVALFYAENITTRILRGTRIRLKLEANYRATWAITAGNPGGFSIEYNPPDFGTATNGPDEAFLVGVPANSGSFTVSLTATRWGTSSPAAATANLTVVDTLPRTTIGSNASLARDGVITATGDTVNIALQSTPTGARWESTGLPPGVFIDQFGTISGVPTRPGSFLASITAQAMDFETSLPLTIKFNVGTGTTPVDSSAATLRAPWLLGQWELTDLQVVARSRDVQSTMFDGNGQLRIKLGDAINFAVFFVDQNNAVFALNPARLRLTIRKADNLDDLIILKSSTPPTAAEQDGQTYYLMPVTTGNREREVALEWAEENGKNDPLECVADLDWIVDGKLYSSRTFPVLLELDVTRP